MHIEQHSVTKQLQVNYCRSNIASQRVDELANEVRVALVYNGISHTVMMATPKDLDAFAIGFTLSERIVDTIAEIKDIEIKTVAEGIIIFIDITQRRFMALKDQKRSMAGRTGCGLCGVSQLEQAVKPIIQVPNLCRFNLNDLIPVLEEINQFQPVFKQTGATHAAMALSQNGDVMSCFEDVGRHIALDKLIGHCAQTKESPKAVLLTSRASFEMVQKAASSGIEIIFAISAATSLAVDLAEKSNITLVGFCRNGRASIYTHPQRVIADETLTTTAGQVQLKPFES